MRHRDYRNPIASEDVRDPALRKNVFREMARDFIAMMKEGGITDRPGTIARMMEAAYRAGLETPRDAETAVSRSTRAAHRPRMFTDMDVPSFPRDRLEELRLWLFGSSPYGDRGDGYPLNGRKDPGHEQIVLFMRPAHPGMPASVSRDEWMLAIDGGHRGFSNKGILPLVKLGLYEASEPDGNGWRFAILTEWGFELLATGSTSPPEARVPGASTTAARYRTCVGDGRVVHAAANALGLLPNEEPSSPRPPR